MGGDLHAGGGVVIAGGRANVRASQVGQIQRDARIAAWALGHVLGDWHAGGLVADDEALCLRCRRAVFLVYGDTYLQPWRGLRRSGTALQIRCDPPRGVR